MRRVGRDVRYLDTLEGLAPTPWEDPSWRAAFLDWLDAALRAHDAETDGPLEVRLRAWSIVVRVPLAGAGSLWAKANPAGSAFEAGLSAALAVWAPEHVLGPLAIDAANGWVLLPDGGATHERPVPDDPPGDHLRGPYRRFAELQVLLAPRIDEVLALGVADWRPAALPDLLDTLLDRVPLPEVAARRSEIADWAAELAASAIPHGLDHGDLHEHQMFRDPAGGDAWRFFDWGTAGVAHPFASLLYPRLYYGTDGAAAIEAAYAAVWPGEAAVRRREADLATRLAAIGWATMRDRNFPGTTDPSAIADHIRSMLGWLIR